MREGGAELSKGPQSESVSILIPTAIMAAQQQTHVHADVTRQDMPLTVENQAEIW
jgi:hypothetical protein